MNPRDDVAIAEKTVPVDDLNRLFPFHGFFSDAPQPLFAGKSFSEDYETAQSCWRYIEVYIFFRLNVSIAYVTNLFKHQRAKYTVQGHPVSHLKKRLVFLHLQLAYHINHHPS